jgi:hypothetical protein
MFIFQPLERPIDPTDGCNVNSSPTGVSLSNVLERCIPWTMRPRTICPFPWGGGGDGGGWKRSCRDLRCSMVIHRLYVVQGRDTSVRDLSHRPRTFVRGHISRGHIVMTSTRVCATDFEYPFHCRI